MAVDTDTSAPVNTDIPEPPAGGSGTPGGASGDAQYNDGASSFAGEAAFNYNATSDILTVAGGFSTAGQYVSALATGTKPIDVASTTVCTNLNADSVDGAHASAFQPVDAGLTSMAALPTAADKMPYSTAADTWAETGLTAFIRSFLDDVDAATARTTLGAGTGNGTVTDVTGTSPIASTGGASPAISLNDDGVTLAKLQNAVANSKLLGSGAAGAGADYVELTLGTNLSMSGTTLNATGGGASLPVVDTTSLVEGSVDPTKEVRLEVDGLTTGTVRVLTVQDSDGTIALLGNKLSAFAATSSAELAGVVSDETGSGLLVFATSPTLTTPTLGVATATSINKVAITAPATSATLTIADGKTATFNKSISFTAAGDLAVLTVPNATDTLMGRASQDTISGSKFFDDGKLFLSGSTSGNVQLHAPAVASGDITFPPGAAITVAAIDIAQTWTQDQTFGTTTKLNFNNTSAYAYASGAGALVLYGSASVTVGVLGNVGLGQAADAVARELAPLSANNWALGSSSFPFAAAYFGGKIAKYNNVTTAGWGAPAIQAAGRSTAQTAAVASVATYTVGAADGSFEISTNVLITTSTTHNFTVTCAYTDEGNTARTLTLTFSSLAGVLATAIINTGGAVPYEGVPLHIRCKAATAITIATTGTFTSVTYNVEGIIKQTA